MNKELEKIRTALANYMASEGCSCCEGDDHDAYKAALAILLEVPMYEDKSGYDFSKFETV